MPLPSSRKAGLRAGRQMQVEPCEIPVTGALASLLPAVQAGNPEGGVTTNKE